MDVVENPGGQDLYKRYAPEPGGVPMWVFLSADGKVLSDSYEEVGGKKENVGFPLKPNEQVHYKKALRSALPKMSDAEVAVVMMELKDAGPKPKEEKRDEKK